uniref:Uncharacterized protein n=1 Tax=Brassica oleracea TaxID=3712 RepID=A0A3P6EYQ0_BRAOL|nr:unnamed protein product [Brassica oleracea]
MKVSSLVTPFFVFILFFFLEIDRINQRFDFKGGWSLWYFGNLRSTSINIHQYGFIGEYFLQKDMENWGQYNIMIGLSLRSIIFVAERGHRRPSNHHGYYKGESEGSRYKSARREDGRNGVPEAGTGAQEAYFRPSSGQPRADQVQKIPPKEAREEGDIKNTGEDDTLLPSLEFQLELAKTQAEGT